MFNDFRSRFQQFMRGRYGMDQLGQFLSVVAVILIFVNFFIVSPILWWAVAVLIVLLYYRMFSRNVAKRYQENQRYSELASGVRGWFSDIRDRITHHKQMHDPQTGYHIYRCPRCHQKIRIPRGKGHIMVKCPKCQFEFHKKS